MAEWKEWGTMVLVQKPTSEAFTIHASELVGSAWIANSGTWQYVVGKPVTLAQQQPQPEPEDTYARELKEWLDGD